MQAVLARQDMSFSILSLMIPLLALNLLNSFFGPLLDETDGVPMTMVTTTEMHVVSLMMMMKSSCGMSGWHPVIEQTRLIRSTGY